MKLKLCDRRGREENPDIELNLTGHEAQCPSIKHPFALQATAGTARTGSVYAHHGLFCRVRFTTVALECM